MARIESLDSLRGIAALAVVLGHGAAVYPGYLDWMVRQPIVPPPVAATAAVQLFFVLSGFVLFLTFTGRDGMRYRPYAIKRVVRIWPPLAAAILLSAALMMAVTPDPVPDYSAWFNAGSWTERPSLGLIAGHFALLDGPRWQSLDNVTWSLVHELRISLLFPLIAWALLRDWRITLLASFALSTIAAGMAWRIDWPVNVAATGQYAFLFAIGGALARHRDAIATGLSTAGAKTAAWPLVAIAVLLTCTAPRLLLGLPTAAGATLLIALALGSPPVASGLGTVPLVWLGRVSYALYLVHVPVLVATLHLLHGTLPLPVLLLIALTLALGVAELMHRLVERPAIALGRRLTRANRGNLAATPGFR